MGIMDKLMFWKKGEDDFGDLGLDKELGGGEDPFGTGMGDDHTGLGDVGTGRQSSRTPGGADDLPGFGKEEHTMGMDRPLGASPEAPQTPEVEGRFEQQDTGSYPQHTGGMSQSRMQPKYPERDQIMIGKELELISTKLDSLRISMDNLNQRIASLERIAKGDYEKTW